MGKVDIGKAYVQIVPTVKGIKQQIEQPLGNVGVSGGKLLGGKLKAALMALGIGKVVADGIKASLKEGAHYEQAVGGVKKLYGEMANIVIANSQKAYQTAGMSASNYMDMVTGVSATLLQSLGNDSKKSAQVADMAIRDMSDNANTFGTSMESIQYAYQGFARNSYAMLDNLKLGYGGTRSEMQRLLQDASKISGVKYDISNLSDVYNAIHVIQGKVGITGTTAREASKTFEGSFNSMKASASNLLASLATGQGDVVGNTQALVQSVFTFIFDNLVPMLGRIVTQFPTVITTIGQEIQNRAPELLEKGGQLLESLVNGFSQSYPKMLPKVLDFIQKMATGLVQKAPELINKGFELLNKLVDGIISGFPIMIQKLPTIITTIANIINDNLPIIILKGVMLIGKLVWGIISAIPTIIANIPKIIQAIVAVFTAFSWFSLGSKVITFLKNGIVGMAGPIGKGAMDIFNTIKGKLVNLPSTLLDLGKNAITFLKNAFIHGISFLRTAAGNIFKAIINALKSMPSKLSSLGKEAINFLKTAFSNGIGKIKSVGGKIVTGIKDTFKNLPHQMLSVGGDIVKGLWNGISNVKDWVLSKIKGFGSSILKGIKGFFGIHSPSRLMRDEVGRYLGEGIGVGLEQSVNSVTKGANSINSAIQSNIQTNIPIQADLSNNDIGKIQKTFDFTSNKTKDNAIERKLDTLIHVMNALTNKNTDLKVYLDSDVLVGNISDRLDNQLFMNQRLKERGI